MCLGIAGEIVELVPGEPDLALVDVNGATRRINIGLLEPDEVIPGAWVLIHLGFALSPISEDEAKASLAFLEACGPEGAQDQGHQEGNVQVR